MELLLESDTAALSPSSYRGAGKQACPGTPANTACATAMATIRWVTESGRGVYNAQGQAQWDRWRLD